MQHTPSFAISYFPNHLYCSQPGVCSNETINNLEMVPTVGKGMLYLFGSSYAAAFIKYTTLSAEVKELKAMKNLLDRV